MRPPLRVRLFVLAGVVVRVDEVAVVHGDGDVHWGHLGRGGEHQEPGVQHAENDEPYLDGAFVVGAFEGPFGERHLALASFGAEAGALDLVLAALRESIISNLILLLNLRYTTTTDRRL